MRANGERACPVTVADALTSVDQTQPGIWDVHSASDQKSLEGTVYSQW